MPTPGSSVNSILDNPYIQEFKPDPAKPRIPFKIEQNAQPTKEELVLFEAASLFRSLSASNKLEPHVFGQATIRNYVRYLEKLGVGTYGEVTTEQSNSIRNMDKFYSRTLGEREHRGQKRGALAEFSTMFSLNKGIEEAGLNLRVIHSKPKEDLENGTDFFIENPENGSLLACQVKSLPFYRFPPKLIYPVTDRKTLYDCTDKVMSRSIYMERGREEDKKNIGRDIVGSGLRLLKFEDEEAPYVGKAMIFVPSNINGVSFDDFSGIPTEDLYMQLNQDLQTEVLSKDPQFYNEQQQ